MQESRIVRIWEGDGTGPAICAGHAWTIWRAEADYHMAVLTGNEEYYKKSLNAFMTNFSKITPEGKSFACYQPDYFTGGGYTGTRETLKQLSSEDIPKRYEITHGYDKEYYNFTIKDIEALTDVRIEKNKRNGRKQELHLRLARGQLATLTLSLIRRRL